MLEKLADCIRKNDFNQFMISLSTQQGSLAKDKTFTLSDADMAQLQTLNKNANDLKKLTQITDARLVFLAILYGRLDIFKVLLTDNSDPSITMGGKDLTKFSLCQHYTSFFDAVSSTTGLLTHLSGGTTVWKESRETSDLDKLKAAAKQGNLASVNEYIRKGVLKEDKEGEALSLALLHGHFDCANALKSAFLSIQGNEILPGHYYAAGMAREHSTKMYNLLRAHIVPGAPSRTFTRPVFIDEGDLEALQTNMSQDPDELASWLFHLIANNHYTCVNFLLKKGVEIKSKHYYAAGKVGEQNIFDAQEYFGLLKGVDGGSIKREDIKLVARKAETRNASNFSKCQ